MKLLATLVALTLAAPGLAQPEPQQTTPPPATTPQFKLINAGHEPRFPLRYQPPVGTVDKVEITSHIRQTRTANGFTDPHSVDATFHFVLRAEVTKSEADTTELALELLSAGGTLPENEGADQPDCSKAKGATGTLKINLIGNVTECTLNPPKDAPPEVAKATAAAASDLEQALLLILPGEVVGTGASWTVTSPVDSKNTEIKFHLQSAAKDRFTVSATADIPVSPPANPGVAVKSTRQTSGLTAELLVATNRALPVRSTLTLKATMDLEGEKSGQTLKATVANEHTITLRSVQSTPPAKRPGK